jgi:bacteriocin-like protein
MKGFRELDDAEMAAVEGGSFWNDLKQAVQHWWKKIHGPWL